MSILISNISQAPKMASVITAASYGLLSLVQTDWLPYIKPLVPAEHWPAVSTVAAAIIVLARLIKQPSLAK